MSSRRNKLSDFLVFAYMVAVLLSAIPAVADEDVYLEDLIADAVGQIVRAGEEDQIEAFEAAARAIHQKCIGKNVIFTDMFVSGGIDSLRIARRVDGAASAITVNCNGLSDTLSEDFFFELCTDASFEVPRLESPAINLNGKTVPLEEIGDLSSKF